MKTYTALVRYPSGRQLNVSAIARNEDDARAQIAGRVGRGEILSIDDEGGAEPVGGLASRGNRRDASSRLAFGR
jgi:hypothetical protein